MTTRTDPDSIARAAERRVIRCPLGCVGGWPIRSSNGTTMIPNPPSYATQGATGYRAKCSVCGVEIVMAYKPLGRAIDLIDSGEAIATALRRARR